MVRPTLELTGGANNKPGRTAALRRPVQFLVGRLVAHDAMLANLRFKGAPHLSTDWHIVRGYVEWEHHDRSAGFLRATQQVDADDTRDNSRSIGTPQLDGLADAETYV